MDYINGKAFFAELTIYHAQYVLSVREETEKPEMSNAIAHAIIQICTRLSNSFNFKYINANVNFISIHICK